MNNSCLMLLGLIKRAGKLDFTYDGCRSAITDHRCCLIILAEDASSSVKNRFLNRCIAENIPLIESEFSKYDFAYSLGSGSCSVLSVNDSGFAKKILSTVGNN